ncbi:MAG: GNAT family N-acetyltransferase [Planctomycetes bacterium]|nr:GNAT family N-acetyltransferase [Planctomycetota bacterium]
MSPGSNEPAPLRDPTDGPPAFRSLRTARLELVPATVEHLRAALASRAELARALGVAVPDTWPHDFLDDAAIVYTLERVQTGGAGTGWWFHFVMRSEAGAPRALIGSAGYKGPPDADGTVEIGYGVVSDARRCGYATEAALALVERAFEDPRVRRVIAETLPELVGSIGVLAACGFHAIDGGSEPGVLRFELTRVAHALRSPR